MTGKKAWGLVWLLALPSIPLHADSLRDAYKAYEKGQFEEAAKGFQSHAQKEPEAYDQLYNTGVALFQKGAHDEAITYFDRAMKSPDPQLKSRSAYNKGVAYGQQQRWEEAEAAFQEALSYDNENTMIQENLQFAREQKNRQKKPESPQNQANQDPNQKNNEQKDAKAEQKQAEQQPGQAQNAQEQQKDAADKKAGQPQDSKAAQDKGQGGQQEKMKQAEETHSAQKDKQGNLAEKQDAQQGAQPQKGEALQPGDAQAGQDKENQRVLTIKDLKKQEAEKLLRSVDDRIGTYILTPEQANTEGKSSNGKDW